MAAVGQQAQPVAEARQRQRQPQPPERGDPQHGRDVVVRLQVVVVVRLQVVVVVRLQVVVVVRLPVVVVVRPGGTLVAPVADVAR